MNSSIMIKCFRCFRILGLSPSLSSVLKVVLITGFLYFSVALLTFSQNPASNVFLSLRERREHRPRYKQEFPYKPPWAKRNINALVQNIVTINMIESPDLTNDKNNGSAFRKPDIRKKQLTNSRERRLESRWIDPGTKLTHVDANVMKSVTKYEVSPPIGKGIKLLIVVTSAPHHLATRRFIRETWANHTLQKELDFRVLFLLGKTPHKHKYLPHIYKESQFNQDVILSNFKDTYRNLTLKSLSLLHFLSKHMDESKAAVLDNKDLLLLKLDDDVLVDTRNLMQSDFLFGQHSFTNGFGCRVNRNSSVNRERSSKWFISEQEWPDSVFPDYCDGPAYFFRPEVVPRLITAFKDGGKEKFFWLEDVFITGILSKEAKIRRRDILHGEFYSKTPMDKLRVLTHFGLDRGDKRKREAWSKILEKWNKNEEDDDEQQQQQEREFEGDNEVRESEASLLSLLKKALF